MSLKITQLQNAVQYALGHRQTFVELALFLSIQKSVLENLYSVGQSVVRKAAEY